MIIRKYVKKELTLCQIGDIIQTSTDTMSTERRT